MLEIFIPSIFRHVEEGDHAKRPNTFLGHYYFLLLYSIILHSRKKQLVVHIFSIGTFFTLKTVQFPKLSQMQMLVKLK